jgi:periplasmic protein TonB
VLKANMTLLSANNTPEKDELGLLVIVIVFHALMVMWMLHSGASQAPVLQALELSLGEANSPMNEEHESKVKNLANNLLAAQSLNSARAALATNHSAADAVPAPAPTKSALKMPTPTTPVDTQAASVAAVAAPNQTAAHAPNPNATDAASQTTKQTSLQGVSQPQASSKLGQVATLPNVDAAYLTNPRPAYPSLSRRLGESGTVLLNVWVNVNGDVQSLTVAQSSGFARLDDAAQKTVSTWRFTAGHVGGQAQAMWVKVPISFILEK